ncbi:growth factor receptor bound protein 14 [Trichuris trichiura]|uniref:Growth factor receptor bound protein 14 n=1 Tax=Trichuris trichiura TaxID=36087 RepID=A0A077ZEC8_TRITR|nr:growth factor receptor bound protein 14 [Trichuris trichiura]
MLRSTLTEPEGKSNGTALQRIGKLKAILLNKSSAKIGAATGDGILDRLFRGRNHRRHRCSHSVSEGVFTFSSESKQLEDDCKVPMDFTKPLGKIVTDPKETRNLLEEEQRRATELFRNLLQETKTRSYENIAQPWFHENLTRHDATTILRSLGFKDGTFLIRKSHTWQGCFVLSLAVKKTVHHYPIIWIKEKKASDKVFYSIDGGKTKFHDLIQLVEFYRVNTGYCLPIVLGDYVTAIVDVPCHANLTMQGSI